MKRKGISMSEFNNKWGMTREYTPAPDKLGGETRQYHNEVIKLVTDGLNAADICRELRQLGYTKDPSTLRWYIKKYVDIPLTRYHNNQYTRSNTCKQGHPWTEENAAYYHSEGKTTKRCRICINANARARNAARRSKENG